MITEEEIEILKDEECMWKYPEITVLQAIENALQYIEQLETEKKEILDLIFGYGEYDGGHHKQWLIDQIVRKLTKNNYEKWVERYQEGFDGQNTYAWDTGIAP